MKPEGSISQSQELSNNPHPGPNQSISRFAGPESQWAMGLLLLNWTRLIYPLKRVAKALSKQGVYITLVFPNMGLSKAAARGDSGTRDPDSWGPPDSTSTLLSLASSPSLGAFSKRANTNDWLGTDHLWERTHITCRDTVWLELHVIACWYSAHLDLPL